MKKFQQICGQFILAGGFKHLDRLYKQQTLRKEIGVSFRKFILLSVGELQERKNHIVVINALAELRNPDIVYIIAGDGKLRNVYREIIDSNGMTDNIKLLGFRTDIAALCEMADCFVHPSIREGLGIAPLEAMASGLPLISAKINGILDYTEDGKTGCCVDPRSVEEMKTAITHMYSDPTFRARCGKHNMEVAKTFSVEESSKVMRRVYKRSMEN